MEKKKVVEVMEASVSSVFKGIDDVQYLRGQLEEMAVVW